MSNKPVARVMGYHGGRCVIEPLKTSVVLPVGIALYTHPAPQPVPLTDGEIENIAVNLADAEIGRALKGEETNFSVEFARAIERAHGIGGEA